MQKKVPKYQIKQDLLKVIGHPKKCSRLTNAVKNLEDFNTIIQILTETIQIIPQFERRCWGNLVPRTIKELGKEKMYFYKPVSLKNEINWTILGIKRHIEIIKEFIEYKKLFEHQVLLGEFYKAIETLTEIEKRIGVSIWLYESKFLLYEMMGSQENSILLISEINESRQDEEEDNGFVTLLLYYLYNRSKKDLSANKYDEDLFNKFKRNKTDFQKDTYSYHLFRLNYYMHYNIEDTSIPLIMEVTNSIIDRYITLIQVFQSTYVKGNNLDVLVSRSQYLYKLTNDPALIPFLYLKQSQSSIENYYNKNYIDIIDAYYKGDYKDVIKKCQTFVKKDTSNFDVIKLYSYSLLYAGNGYSPIYSNILSPINQIAKKIFDSINENDNTAPLYNLYQLNKNLYSFAISNGLDYFIKDEENSIKSKSLRLLSLKHFDPLFSTFFKDDKEALLYLEDGLSHFGPSISIEHQIRRIKKEITPKSLVADYIEEEDNAKILYLNQEYEKSYNLWITILQKNSLGNPISQTTIKFAFDCLIKLEKYQDAIKLFVDEYIKNPISTKKTDVTSFMQLLKKQKYKGIKRTIELPIFVGLNSLKDTDKSFILQSFCDYYDVKKPSELFDIFSNFNKGKVETFFFVIVNEDILRHYVYINSTQESLEEKHRILNFLINMKTANEFLYKGLADEVLEELIVYTGARKIDESKIFANDQAIIKYELKDIEGLYDSFKVQYKLLETGTKTFLFLDSQSLFENDSLDGAILKANVKYTDNAIHQVAYDLYDTIREKFLFSKFGLGTYLSTRIRHGVLEGELRSDFVAHNLILNKTNDKYVNNDFWAHTYGLDKHTNEQLNNILADFSEEVDNLISNFKSEILQIKVDKSDKGMFDYYIDSESLSIESLKIAFKAKESQDFCQLVIKNLWEVTERNLSNIRNYIKYELSEKFHNLFNDLMSKTSILTFEHLNSDITSCITDVRANFSQKLLRIEGWFHIQESKFEDFNLKDLINIAWESTRKFYPKVNCECQLNLRGADLNIKAIYGIHFSDILRIFLTNMFKYSASAFYSDTIDVQINTTIENNILLLTFENDIVQNEDDLNKKFKTLLDSQKYLQLEGGSGLIKSLFKFLIES